MPVWGRGVLTLPVSKNVKMKKKKQERKKDEKKKKEAKNTNSIDTVFGRNFHFVSRTEGEKLRTARTDTSLFGGRGPGRCVEESVPAKTGKSKRANKTTPTRHPPVLPKRSTLRISPGDFLFLFQYFWGRKFTVRP